MTALLQRITIQAGKCGGRPSLRGLRVRVQDVLEMLASGMSADEILDAFPYLELDDIRASLSYAALQVGGDGVNLT